MKRLDWLAPFGLGAIAVGLLLGAGIVGWSSGWSFLPVSLGSLCLAGWVGTHIRQIQAFFGLRSTQSNANILVAIAAVLLILGVVNFMGARYTAEFDITETGVARLSPQTQAIVRDLQQPVNVVAVSSAPPSSLLRQQLERYQRLNPAQFSFEFVDPRKDPVRTRALRVTTDNTLVVVTGARQQQLPIPVPLAFESELTPTLVQTLQSEDSTIYFLEGHGELPLESSPDTPAIGQAITALENEGYSTVSLNLVEDETIPADAAAIAIVAPQRALFPAEVERLQTYLDVGGRLLLLLSPQVDAGLQPLLSNWDIELSDDVVVDVSQMSQLLGFGPVVTVVTNYGDHPITQPIAQQGLMTIFPAARSFAGNAEDGNVILLSNDSSWGEMEPEGSNVAYDEGRDRLGPLPLGVAVSREVASAENPPAENPPAENGTNADASDDDATATSEGVDSADEAPTEARLVAIGNAAFIADGTFNQQGNRDLFLNAVNWLVERDALLSIRPKSAINRRFSLTSQNFAGLSILSIVLLPLLALGTGFTVWWQRR